MNHRLLFGAPARFNGSDEFGRDRNLVKRRHSAIHNDPGHDLAGERVRAEAFHAQLRCRYGRQQRRPKRVGAPDRTRASACPL